MQIDEILDDTLATWQRERPDLDFSGMDTFLRLSSLVQFGATAVREDLAHLGVSIAEFDVLATLRRHGDGARLTPGFIAQVAMVKPSGLSHRLSRLEKAGLIRRDIDHDDRRSILVEITAVGREVADRGIEITARRQHDLLAGLSAAQRASFDDAIDAMIRRQSTDLVTPR